MNKQIGYLNKNADKEEFYTIFADVRGIPSKEVYQEV